MEIVVEVLGLISVFAIIFGFFWVLNEDWKSENRRIMKINEMEHEAEINERRLGMLHELGPEIEIEERMRELGIKQAEQTADENSIEDAK